MDESLKDPKRLLEDSATDPRPPKRHSPSSVASPPSPSPNATSSTTGAPRSTNMRRLNVEFNYFTTEADADSNDEQDNSIDPYGYSNYSMSSSPTARPGIPDFTPPPSNDADSQEPPMCPGAHALKTLNMYLDLNDDQEPCTDDTPRAGVAVVHEAAATPADPNRSTSPDESSMAVEGRPTAQGQAPRTSPRSSTGSNEDDAIDLRDYDEAGRAAILEQVFSGNTIPLENFKIPDLRDLYPEHAVEILAACIKYTTFTVKVWANYDSCIKKLYLQETRIQTCGKLQLSAHQRKHLESVDGLQFSKVQLDIGNPFRTFFKVELHAELGKLRVSGKEVIKDIHGPHARLRCVVREAIKRIREDGILKGRFGLKMWDLDEIAKEFVYRPNKIQHDLREHFAN